MDASSWFASSLWGRKRHGGSDAPTNAHEARRQAAIRHMLDPEGALQSRVVEPDASSAAIFADRDQAAVDYASGAGY